jgi:hypothetical protein
MVMRNPLLSVPGHPIQPRRLGTMCDSTSPQQLHTQRSSIELGFARPMGVALRGACG